MLINRAAFALIDKRKFKHYKLEIFMKMSENFVRMILNFALMIAIPFYLFSIDNEGTEDAVT